MAEPGGALRRQEMIDAGAPVNEVDTWIAGRRQEMIDAGAPVNEVDTYWGLSKPEPPMNRFNAAFGAPLDVIDDPKTRVAIATSPLDYIAAGLQRSTSGLIARGRNPDTVLPEDAGLFAKVLSGAGQAVGDIPTTVAGLIIGAYGGAAVGSAVATGPGTIIGGAIGAGAGAVGLTELARAALIDQYNHPEGAKTWDEVWSRGVHIVKEGAKGAAIGAIAAPAGAVGGKVMLATGAGSIVAGGGAAVTGAVTGTAVGGALEGAVPSAEDFFAGAILGVGAHAYTVVGAKSRFVPTPIGEVVMRNLHDIYATTGAHPKEVMRAAQSDPVLLGEILAPRNVDGTRDTPVLDASAPPEPEPYTTYKPTAPETIPAAKEGEVAPDPKKVALDKPEFMTPELLPADVKKGVVDLELPLTPERAALYGLQPNDPEGPATVLADLYRRFDGQMTDVLVAYAKDPTTAAAWIRNGRDIETLPLETRKVLLEAERLGLIDEGYNVAAAIRVLDAAGKPGDWAPAEGLNPSMYSSWTRWPEFKDAVVALMDEKGKVSKVDPNIVAGYMQKFARLAKFKIAIGPGQTERGGADGPFFKPGAGMIYMPNTNVDLFRRWYGLRAEQILYHEAGHAIDQRINPDKTSNWLGRGPLHEEMIAVSKEFRPKLWGDNPIYNGTQNELMADSIAAWLSDPTARKRMPLFTERFGKKLEPYLEAANKALPTLNDKGEWVPPKDDEEPAAAGGGGGRGVGPPKRPRGPQFEPPKRGPKKVDDTTGDLADVIVDKEFDRLLPPIDNSMDIRRNVRLLFNEFEQELTSARRLDREIGGKNEQGLGIEEALRGTYGSAGIAQLFLGTDGRSKGTVDVRTGKVDTTNNFADAYRMVKDAGGTMEEFERYRIAKRTIEKAAQGIETGLPLYAAQQFVARKGMAAKYDEAVAMLTRTKDAAVDYARDSGIFTSKGAASMKELNRFHITMRRVIDPDHTPAVQGVSKGKFRVKNPTVKMEGSDKPYISPAAMDVSNLVTMIAMADRNRAILKVLDIVDDYNKRMTPEKGGMPLDLKNVTQEILGKDEASGKPLFGEILDDEGNPVPKEAEEAVRPFLAYKKDFTKRLTKDDFIVYRDGKLEIYRSTNEYLTRAIQAGTAEFIPNQVVNILGWAANIQRRGITSDIGFIFRSLVQGQWSSAVNAEGVRMMPFKEIFKGFGVPDHLYEMWITNGGASTALAEINRNYIQTDMAKIFEDTGGLDRMWNVVKHPLEATSAFAHMLDTKARLGRFVGNVEGGVVPAKAAMISRTAQLDYSERFVTQWMNSWGRWVPFLTTGFKDLGQWTSSFRDHPIETGTKALMYITMPAIANALVNYAQDEFDPRIKEEDKYSNIPQEERNAYMISPMLFDNDRPGGYRIKIKRPYTGGFFFSTLPEMFIRWVAETTGGAFKGILSQFIMQTLPPITSLSVATPLVEQLADVKLYNFRKLIPARLERVSGPMQYTDDTTETAKALARLVGKGSPIIMENYARAWLGPLPLSILKVLEAGANKVIPGIAPGAGKPLQLADTPFLGFFFFRNRAGGEALSRYYDDIREFDTAHADLDLAKDRQNEAEIIAAASNPMAMARVTNARKAVTSITTAINAVNVNKDMTREEKLKYTDLFAAQLVSAAREGSAAIRALREAKP